MSDPSDASPSPSAPRESVVPDPGRRVFDSRDALLDAWHTTMDVVAARGGRELFLCDASHRLWPLGDRHTLARLSAWALPHRRLIVLAAQFDELARLHPAWVAWRRQWSHVVQCRQVDEADVADMPTMALAPGVVGLRVRDGGRGRGRLSTERDDLVRDRDDLDAFLQRSTEAFPVTTLGL